MDPNRFDDLVAQLHRGQIGRRRFLWQAVTLGLGATGISAGLTKAQSDDPTPTPAPPVRIAPEPTATVPSSIPIDPTPTPFPEREPPLDPTPTTAVEPTWPPTPTSVPEITSDPAPTATATAQTVQAADEPGSTQQQFPCPHCPDSFCFPTPWYPIIPDPDTTTQFGIAWYGMQVDNDSAFAAGVAFGQDGQEISRYESQSDGNGGLGWSIADDQTRLAGEIAVEEAEDGSVSISGLINEQRFAMVVARDGTAEGGLDPALLSLDPAQLALLAQWSPVSPDLGGVGAIISTPGDDSEAGCLGCSLSLGGCALGAGGCAGGLLFACGPAVLGCAGFIANCKGACA